MHATHHYTNFYLLFYKLTEKTNWIYITWVYIIGIKMSYQSQQLAKLLWLTYRDKSSFKSLIQK